MQRRSNKDDLFSPPFVHSGHFGHTSADTHTRLLPWLPEPIKRPGIKGELSRGQEGGGGDGCWLLDDQLCSVLAGWRRICGPIHGHLHCVTKVATDIIPPLTHRTFLETRRIYALTYPPTSYEKKTKNSNWQMFHLRYETHPQAGLQQADLSEAHSWNRQEITELIKTTLLANIQDYSNLLQHSGGNKVESEARFFGNRVLFWGPWQGNLL